MGKKKTKERYHTVHAQTEMLLTKEQTDFEVASLDPSNRDNIAAKMSYSAQREAVDLINDRFESARETTEAMDARIAEAEKLYKGEWINTDENSDERVFIPKTREHVSSVRAYILQLISQLNPIVRLEPMVSNIYAAKEEYDRAKVMEALLNFYFEDAINLKSEVLPVWVNHFLKHPSAFVKVEYSEDAFRPDLRVVNVDRANLYVDPTCKDIKEARWVIERYFVPRSEVYRRMDSGIWHLPEDNIPSADARHGTATPSNVIARLFGGNFTNTSQNKADELVEVWDYWQSPKDGLSDVYAVMIGGHSGELVRYGKNPFPYKGIPYRGKSYDPDDNLLDGQSLVDQFAPFQRIINTYFDIRREDLLKNAIQPVIALSAAVDQQTIDDINSGDKLIRASSSLEAWMAQTGNNMSAAFFPIPATMSTDNILNGDLPFIMGLGQAAAGTSDVFRGQAPARAATATQIQEQLSANQGNLRPVYMRCMRMIEEIAEIFVMYFKDPEFFPEDRIIQVVGQNRYVEAIAGFQNVEGSNTFVRSVTPDEMDVDVTINAVNQADALSSRTLLVSGIADILQAAGQHPALLDAASKELNFGRMFEMILAASGHDIEALRLTPKEKQANSEAEKQAQQQAMQAQAMTLQQEEQAKAQAKIAVEQAKAQATGMLDSLLQTNKVKAHIATSKVNTLAAMAVDANKQNIAARYADDAEQQRHYNTLEEIITKIMNEKVADIAKMYVEAELEQRAGVQSVGSRGHNIDTPKGDTNG